MKIQSFLNYVHSPKKGIKVRLVRGCLYAMSLGYKLVVSARNNLYDSCAYLGRGFRIKFFRVNIYNFKARIISIGNIVAGGTGKTPLTILVAKEIVKRNKKLAILSRGYKAKMKKDTFGPQLISEGLGPLRSALECGDEPFLISRSIPEALFYVGKNRVEASRMALKKGAKVLLLDDGMQHRKLHRDFEIVTMDAKDLFGKNYFLPRGFLRDQPKSLQRADLIVVNHVKTSEEMGELKRQIRLYSQAPIVGVYPSYLETVDIQTGKALDIKGKKIAAFCGIAKPGHFYGLLKDQQACLIQTLDLADHQKITFQQLKNFAEQAHIQGADLIVCTEKDAVKVHLEKSLPLPIAYVKMELKILFGQKEFEEAIEEMI